MDANLNQGAVIALAFFGVLAAVAYTFFVPLRRPPVASGVSMGIGAKERALDVLAAHGITAYYYMPALGIEDREFADALRLLGERGFLMVDSTGELVGPVELARPSPDERAAQRRAMFRVVD